MNKEELLILLPDKTENFEVHDTIGVPHPYCITPKHLQGDGMYLDIERAEKDYGARCDICKGELSYEEHEQAVLIKCKKGTELQGNEELQEYLLSLKDRVEANNLAGFAFMEAE